MEKISDNLVLVENINEIKKLNFIKLDNFSIYPLNIDVYNQLIKKNYNNLNVIDILKNNTNDYQKKIISKSKDFEKNFLIDVKKKISDHNFETIKNVSNISISAAYTLYYELKILSQYYFSLGKTKLQVIQLIYP